MDKQNTTSSLKSSELSRREKVIKGLIDTKELSYVNQLISPYFSSESGTWRSFKKNINKELDFSNNDCTNLSILEELVDSVICSADHSYQIVQLSTSEAKSIRDSLVRIDLDKISSIAKNLYPMKIEFSPGPKYPVGEELCKIRELDNGIACIFSSIVKEKIKHTNQYYYIQNFNTVFIPNDKNRLEFRVSNKVSAFKKQTAFTNLEVEFINLLGISSIKAPVSVLNAISSFFDDKNEGRVQYAMMTTDEDGDDAELNGKARKKYCARQVSVSDEANEHVYICRNIKLRYKGNKSEESLETELAISPHKRDWDSKTCTHFTIKHPVNAVTQGKMIENVISRI